MRTHSCRRERRRRAVLRGVCASGRPSPFVRHAQICPPAASGGVACRGQLPLPRGAEARGRPRQSYGSRPKRAPRLDVRWCAQRLGERQWSAVLALAYVDRDRTSRFSPRTIDCRFIYEQVRSVGRPYSFSATLLSLGRGSPAQRHRALSLVDAQVMLIVVRSRIRWWPRSVLSVRV
jgi:hypothetical protein